MLLKPPKLQDRENVLIQWINGGSTAHQNGDLKTAEVYYLAILKVVPKHPETIHLLGMLHHARGQNERAIKLILEALKYRPDFLLARLNLGNIYFGQRRFEESLACYDQILKTAANYAEAWSNRSNALRELGRPADALSSVENALRLHPELAELHAQLGLALAGMNRFEEAIASCDRALALKPDLDIAYLNRFTALHELDRLEEGVRSCELALQLKPGFIDAMTWRGLFLKQLGRTDLALLDFRAAAALAPENASVQHSLSDMSLMIGDFTTGWDLYDHRFEKPTPVSRAVHLQVPTWTGQGLAGKRILVYEEQGLGDVIQFARYLALLEPLCDDITFLVGKKLHRLLRPLAPHVRFVADSSEIARKAFDYQCPLLSLPKAFGTTLETVPSNVPYIHAEPALIAKWQDRLGAHGFKIAIAWQGTPDGKLNRGRSPALANYAPLSQIAGVRLISVQKNFGTEQLDDLSPSMIVETLGPNFDSGPDAFVDTAAVLAAADLIITSDTSIAHLAGALGRPVWVALKHIPEWRWMLDRTDSPWYPTMKLYRQTTRGNWSDVFATMAKDAASLFIGK